MGANRCWQIIRFGVGDPRRVSRPASGRDASTMGYGREAAAGALPGRCSISHFHCWVLGGEERRRTVPPDLSGRMVPARRHFRTVPSAPASATRPGDLHGCTWAPPGASPCC
jgi:hypothetical protein